MKFTVDHKNPCEERVKGVRLFNLLFTGRPTCSRTKSLLDNIIGVNFIGLHQRHQMYMLKVPDRKHL